MLSIFKRHDWYLNAAILFFMAASFIILYSIKPQFFWRQLAWWAVSAGIIVLFTRIDWRTLVNYRWVIYSIYGSVLLLLLATILIAPSIRHAKSWIVIGTFQFQTSELAKTALIILLSYFLARYHVGIANWRVLLTTFLYFALPAGLILLQPDLGTVLIIFGIWFGFLLVSGIRWRHLLIGFLVLAVLAGVCWNYFLKDYQKSRIRLLFNPEADPLGINYNVIQSKIAIGSAGWFGKGFKQGTQVQLGFLPESHSDFILASFIEEWGLIGGLAVVGMFVFLVLRIIKIGLESENNFSKLICLGTAFMFLMQFMLNVGSTIGLLPVVGVSFPFLSYGGSNLLTNSILIGIIQSIVVRK